MKYEQKIKYGLLIASLWMTSWIIRNVDNYHRIQKGADRFEITIPTKEYHDKWMVVNWGFIFGSGAITQPCRVIVKMDGVEVRNFISEKSPYTDKPTYYIETRGPIFKSDSVTYIVEPLSGKFESSYTFRIGFMKGDYLN